MQISGISIQDTFGTKDFKVSGFSVLRINGHNGSGKSSILRALGYLFGGGTDPSVIRKGAEQSIVELTLSDGTKIVKTTRPKKARKGGEVTGYTVDLEVTQPDGTPRPAPQTFINDLATALAVDPSTLLRIDATTVPGRRALAAELLKLVPISFAAEEVNRAVSYRSSPDVPRDEPDVIALAQSPEAPLGLDDLKKAAVSVTEQRRREGQIRNDTEGAINRLQAALPDSGQAKDETALKQELADAEEFRREIDSAIFDAKLDVEKEKGVAVTAATTAWSVAVSDINADIDAQIAALQAQKAERNNAARNQLDAAKAAAQTAAGLAVANIDAEAAPQLQKAIEDVTTAKDRIAAHVRAITLREEIEVQRKACGAADWKYDRLSEVLQRVEALRLEKLQNLPVAGLSVEDGTPYLDGIEWQNVNLARRVEAVLQICTQQTGKLPLILWDDSEHADSEMRRAIEAGLVEAGYQVIEALVSDGPLTIETVNASEPVSA